jgi:hypothetical protein
MALAASSVIRRHLKGADGFKRYEGGRLPFSFEGAGEDIVGWYQNPRPWVDEYVVFTSAAIYWRMERGWVRVPIDAIDHYEMPKSKSESDGVEIRTFGGETLFIRFAGRSGRDGEFSDAFCLVGLLRVLVLRNNRALDVG